MDDALSKIVLTLRAGMRRWRMRRDIISSVSAHLMSYAHQEGENRTDCSLESLWERPGMSVAMGAMDTRVGRRRRPAYQTNFYDI